MKNSLLLCCIALCGFSATSLSAQIPVFEDDFNDGIVDPAWTVEFDPLQFWDVREEGGLLKFENLTAPFGAMNEQYKFTATVPDNVGGFKLEFNMRWMDAGGQPRGSGAAICVVTLMDSSLTELTSFKLEDLNTTGGGDLIFTGSGTATIPSVPISEQANVTLVRNSSDEVTYEVTSNFGNFNGSVGFVSGTVSRVRIYFEHSTLCGPCGPFVGPTHLDYIRYFDTPGPFLSTSGLMGGSPAALTVADATPNRPVVLAYSVAGGGPTSTSVGAVLLSPPIVELATVSADLNGVANLVANVPGKASGATVWLQAYDVDSKNLSNGVEEQIQ